MDASDFDNLLLSLAKTSCRRDALRVLVGGFLAGSTALIGTDEVGAKKHHKKKKKKRKNPEVIPLLPPGPPQPTCTDGIKNGAETDIDCGGSCPRCNNGQLCRGQDDCRSGLCVSGVCRACVVDTDCGIDAAGPCRCDLVDRETQQRVCNNTLGGLSVADCDDCPPDTNCHRVGDGEWICRSFCGVP